MSERKVLNKYYPPDFDPTKIPKVKGPRNHTFNIRTMAPFNMRCNTCGEYIYKGKKFNSRKETVDGENYLGLHIFRFYIKCPRCVAEIAFKTDPESTDYKLEAGATRNFEASKTAMELAVKAQKEKEEEELNNPMKVLENRTKQSRNEMERMENLEELRELNSRHAKVDHEQMIVLHAAYEEQLRQLQDQEDEAVISKAFGRESVKRLADSDSDSDETASSQPSNKIAHLMLGEAEKPTDILVEAVVKGPGSRPAQESLKSLVRPKHSSIKGIVLTKKSSSNCVKNANSATNTNMSDVTICPRQSSDTKVVERQKIVVGQVGNASQPVSAISSVKPSQMSGALSLLGNYSESSESD